MLLEGARLCNFLQLFPLYAHHFIEIDMTIAQRLVLLVALPIAVLLALGGYISYQLRAIEQKNRFVSEMQIESLATLGNISSQLTDMRVNVRNYLLADEAADAAEPSADLRQHSEEMTRLLDHYGDALITDDADRRMWTDFRNVSREWTLETQKLIAMAANGHRREARAEMISGYSLD